MITNRSSHMPTFTNIATTNSRIGVVRTFRNQSACGAMMLQSTSSQYAHAVGAEHAVEHHVHLEDVPAVPGVERFHDVRVGDDQAGRQQ